MVVSNLASNSKASQNSTVAKATAVAQKSAAPSMMTGYNSTGQAVQVQRGVYTPGISATASEALANAAKAQAANKVDISGGITAPPQSSLDKYYQNFQMPDPAAQAAQEEAMRQAEMERQAKEIAGIDTMYQNLFQGANQDAARNLATTEYVNGMSGLGGSNVGASNAVNTQIQNAAGLQKIKDAHGKEVQSVVDQHRVFLADQIKTERDLRNKDYEKWVNYQSGKESGAKNSVNTIMTSMLSKYTPDQIDEKSWDNLSKGTGMSPAELKAAYANMHSSYQTDVATASAAKLKSAAEVAKINAEAGNIGNAQRDNLIKQDYIPITSATTKSRLAADGYIFQKMDIGGGKTEEFALPLTFAQQETIKAKNAAKLASAKAAAAAANNNKPLNAEQQKAMDEFTAILGPDGYADTAKYQDLKARIATQSPSIKAWFDKSLPGKEFLNPRDETSPTYVAPKI